MILYFRNNGTQSCLDFTVFNILKKIPKTGNTAIHGSHCIFSYRIETHVMREKVQRHKYPVVF